MITPTEQPSYSYSHYTGQSVLASTHGQVRMWRHQLKFESIGFAIQIRRIWNVYFKCIGFGFTAQSQLVQSSQVKNAKFCLKFKGV